MDFVGGRKLNMETIRTPTLKMKVLTPAAIRMGSEEVEATKARTEVIRKKITAILSRLKVSFIS